MHNDVLGKVKTSPVKSFFVHMLTRDIELQDAILDLLDNCVDGIQRSESEENLGKSKPYADYWARISLSEAEFRIQDNCGGIPWKLHDYAFRMGRVNQELSLGHRTIGTYGIGMKRAIFKMGEDGTIETHAKDESYRVHFSADWMKSESVWDIDAEKIEQTTEHGTTITVRKLRETVRRQFSSPVFVESFREILSTYYAFIISKGFSVYLDDELVQPKKMRLLFAEAEDHSFDTHRIEPFIYHAEHQGVGVLLAVGFTRSIPDKEEAEDSFENYKERYSSADAGWTIVCNDRTVLYCDKTAVTGWGISGVPQYHMQFIAISGIVVFTSEDPSQLPTTTTKRGIDPTSELYLYVKDKMIEGMKLFTSYTNAWKQKELVKASRNNFKQTSNASLEQLREKMSKIKMNKTSGVLKGRQYKPVLPKPVSHKDKTKIAFTKRTAEVRLVSKYLFDTPSKKPTEVGETCFDLILEEAEG